MSGGGGGSDYPVSGGSGTGAGGSGDGCAGFRSDRELKNPEPALIGGLVVGQVLAVVLRDGSVATIDIVVPATGDVVGTIVPLALLIDCLRLGYPFDAVVRSVSASTVLLDIKPQ